MSGAMFVPEWDHEMANTRKMLEAIPEDRLDYKPHDKSWSLLELAGHISNVPMWVAPTFTMDELDMAQPWDRKIPTNKVEILAEFDSAVAGARPVLEATSGETLGEMWTLRTGDEVHLSMPKGAVFRFFVMNHLVHHRAQLSIYLRMLDVPVPGMYGPSADEAM